MFMCVGSAVDVPLSRSSRTIMVSENVQSVKHSFLQSPRRSARKHAMAPRLYASTVERILHFDIPFSQDDSDTRMLSALFLKSLWLMSKTVRDHSGKF